MIVIKKNSKSKTKRLMDIFEKLFPAKEANKLERRARKLNITQDNIGEKAFELFEIEKDLFNDKGELRGWKETSEKESRKIQKLNEEACNLITEIFDDEIKKSTKKVKKK